MLPLSDREGCISEVTDSLSLSAEGAAYPPLENFVDCVQIFQLQFWGVDKIISPLLELSLCLNYYLLLQEEDLFNRPLATSLQWGLIE